MKYRKGQSGNPNGRGKGVKNKATVILRESVTKLLEDNYKLICDDFNSLEPKDRINTWIKLLEFSLSKLKSVDVESNEPYNIILNLGHGVDISPIEWVGTKEWIGPEEDIKD